MHRKISQSVTSYWTWEI